MITSDAITWNASTDEHPARSASQRSYSAVAKGDLAEWLTVYAPDAVIEDPVGPSMFDPEGKGHHGHEEISAFWKLAIEPIEKFDEGLLGAGPHDGVVHRRSLSQAELLTIHSTSGR
jgi:ketosteroid isomerase-like protein